MKNTLVKIPLKQYIVKYLYLFLIPLVVVPFAVSYGVNQKLKTKSFEQLNVFISSPVKENKEEELAKKLFTGLSEQILSVNIYTFDKDNVNGQESLYSYYLSISDVIILDSVILEGSTMSVFSSLPDEYKNESTYKEKYGYKVYDKESKTGYCVDYLSYKEYDYYMFINKSSEHQKAIDEQSVSNDAFTVFNNFIS
ncbi:MAG: hypothetical protein MJ248_03815 [Bacilli bacterium]|nr:hypothetical protein [Bacilli bacterium]